MYVLIPAVISFFLMGAHFLRSGALGLTLMCLTAPLALLIKRKWIVNVFTVLLLFIAFDWISTAHSIWLKREVSDQPSTRMIIILASVALFSAGSALAFRTKKMKERYSSNAAASGAGTAAFFLTFISISYIALSVDSIQVLLLERVLFAGSFFEAFWLAIYAGFLADFMQNPLVSQYLRPKIWLFFSIVFFSQLLLGLFGLKGFLMTGTLHIPVPMVIAAGPIFRKGGFFMLALFAASTVLAGSAWCSYLCYFGSFDNLAACSKKKPGEMPKWRNQARIGILAATITGAMALGYFSVKPLYAVSIAIAFGIAGIGVMLIWSRKNGVMTHCTAYCPIGFVANILGKVNPFRIRINKDCNACGACTALCRYDALNASDIELKRPGGSCTLCGDCVSACRRESIDYYLPLLSPERARTIFIVIVITLHAIFLGMARV